MPAVRRLSVIQQTAAHLLTGIHEGRWGDKLPGVRPLSEELGVSRDSLRAAVKLLEAEGHVTCPGAGRRRQVSGKQAGPQRALRIGVLLHLPLAKQNAEMQRTLGDLRHDFESVGHIWVFASKAHRDLGDDPKQIAKVIAAAEADVWIIVAGSRGLLEWFSTQKILVIAFGGPSIDLPIAVSSIDFVPPTRAVVRHLTSLGHRRIVLISPPQWREPIPSRTQQAFFDELRAQGISASEYNAPAWDESAAGLHRLLDSLFQITPPTALLVVEPPRVLAVLQFLNQHNLRIPQDVSLVCMGQDSMFEWCDPPLAHFRYDLSLPKQRIVKWIAAVSRGTSDRKFRLFAAQFDPGGSTGPAAKH